MQDIQDSRPPLCVNKETAKSVLGGISDATFYRLLNRGDIEAIKVGDRIMPVYASLLAYVKQAPRFGSKRRTNKKRAA